MSCCAPGSEVSLGLAGAGDRANEIRLTSRMIGDGLRQTDLSVPGLHCGACIQQVEAALAALPGVESARVNLSSKRATVRWSDAGEPPQLIETLLLDSHHLKLRYHPKYLRPCILKVDLSSPLPLMLHQFRRQQRQRHQILQLRR